MPRLDEATGLKECTQCGVAKSGDDFYKHKKTKDGLQSGCKTCNADNAKRWRKRNPDYQKTYLKSYVETSSGRKIVRASRRGVKARSRQSKADSIRGIKLTSGCVDCGYRDDPTKLEFDHLPGFDKWFNISEFRAHSWKVIEAEIAKCEVVCRWCHIERTKERGDTQGGNLYRKELQAA